MVRTGDLVSSVSHVYTTRSPLLIQDGEWFVKCTHFVNCSNTVAVCNTSPIVG